MLIHCPKCGQEKEPHTTDKHLCVDCVHAENNRLTYYRQNQEDWIAAAQEQALDVWSQQPGETQWEFTVWTAYRDSYPGKRASYTDVARQLGTTSNVVRKIAQRWSFPVRMQAWMTECDRITLLQRRQEVLDMNKGYTDISSKLREKIAVAVDSIEPATLRPGEIASLFKVAADLERKARVDTIAQEEMRRDLVVDTDNPDLRKSPTKQSDLSQVVDILLKAGALGDVTHIGVRKTETTEVALMDSNGTTSVMQSEGEIVDESED